ncbi:hypothetical protein [Streptomyces buecherae]
MPGDYPLHQTEDPTGAVIDHTHTRDSDGAPDCSDVVNESIYDQAPSHAG